MANVTARVALIGSKGMLANAVLESMPVGCEVHGYDLPDFDITDRQLVVSTLQDLRPDIIINCAAFTNVDACETEDCLANLVNGTAPGYLAEAAISIGATLVHISTDYVFDGRKQSPYLETDSVAPQSAYGRSKLAGELAIQKSGLEKYFIVRTSWLYGPGGNNFVETMIRLAAEREELRVVADQIGTPTYTRDLAKAIFSLLSLGRKSSLPTKAPYGIYHFSNSGECSWHDFAEEIILMSKQNALPIKCQQVKPITTDEYPLPAKRPPYSVFSKRKYMETTGQDVPDWRDGLRHYLRGRSVAD